MGRIDWYSWKLVRHELGRPANVMVLFEEGVWKVKAIDFGLAVGTKVRKASLSILCSLQTTRGKSVTGTVKYASESTVSNYR